MEDDAAPVAPLWPISVTTHAQPPTQPRMRPTVAGQMARRTDLPRRALAGGRVVHTARTWTSRRRGLAGLDALDPGTALHLPRCRSVHTLGMRFALDLVWLDGDGAVVRIDRAVGARRLRTCLLARSVVEVRAGEADAFVAAGL
jgi:hypothetical protein